MGLRHDLTLLRLAPPPAPATNLPAALSDRLLLSNRHQLGVHLAVSGHLHLRSAHSQTTQPAQTHPIRTGGLRRRLTTLNALRKENARLRKGAKTSRNRIETLEAQLERLRATRAVLSKALYGRKSEQQDKPRSERKRGQQRGARGRAMAGSG